MTSNTLSSKLMRALILTLAVLVEGLPRAQSASTPFVVGMLRDTGVLLPFADFDGQTWRNSWPDSKDQKPDLLPLQEIPAIWWGRSTFEPTWETVEPGGRRREVRIIGTDSAGLGSSCSTNIGLQTDVGNTYRGGGVLATNRPGVVQAVEALRPDSADWKGILALIPSMFRQYESVAWKDVPDEWRPNLQERLPRPVLVSAFTSIEPLGQYLYFEAHRDFASWESSGQTRDARTFMTGWLWRRSSTSPFLAIAIRATPTDSDQKDAHSFYPLGAVLHGVRRFWLGELSGYAYGALAVFDVRRNGIRPLVIAKYPGC